MGNFTGHEAKGELINEYQSIFQKESYKHFKPLIEDYNQLISGSDFQQRVDAFLEEILISSSYPKANSNKLINSVRKELTPITV